MATALFYRSLGGITKGLVTAGWVHFCDPDLLIRVAYIILLRMKADSSEPVLQVVFYKSQLGNEPVRDWLKALSHTQRRAIGEDIKTAQFGWPIGMPLIRKIERGLWEVRSDLEEGIARVFFTVESNMMVLLHGFIKKSQKTPDQELETARRRLADLRTEL